MSEMLVPIFDLGGVFIDWNPMYLFRKLFDSEEDAQWFQDTICTPNWNLELDAGMSYPEGIASLTAQYPRYWREIDAYDTRWREMVAGLFQGTIDIHDELIAAEIPTFAITNFSREKWMSMIGEWTFMQKFDGVVVSGIEKLVKPDARIYRLFCERYGLAPENCVFIDDNPVNVAAAQAVGMHAVVFTSSEKLREDLIGFGLPLKP